MTYLNWFWNFFVNVICGSVLIGRHFRLYLYKMCGCEINTKGIRPGVFFYGNKIKIGKGAFLNKGCFLYNPNYIEIGENCYLAPEVMICTASHEIGRPDLRAGKFFTKPVVIKKGTWVGARASIMPGVTIGEGCVIAAGAVVTKDCEPNSFYAGVPAIKVKYLPVK